MARSFRDLAGDGALTLASTARLRLAGDRARKWVRLRLGGYGSTGGPTSFVRGQKFGPVATVAPPAVPRHVPRSTFYVLPFALRLTLTLRTE